jgi:hypothetical protein
MMTISPPGGRLQESLSVTEVPAGRRPGKRERMTTRTDPKVVRTARELTRLAGRDAVIQYRHDYRRCAQPDISYHYSLMAHRGYSRADCEAAAEYLAECARIPR